jgi:hypothetical protein
MSHSAFLQCVHKVTESLAGLGKFVQGLPNLSKAFLSKVNTLRYVVYSLCLTDRNVVVGMIQELKGVQQQQVMPPGTVGFTFTDLHRDQIHDVDEASNRSHGCSGSHPCFF